MEHACNQEFSPIFNEKLYANFVEPFDPEKGLAATVVRLVFSAVPVFGELGEVASKTAADAIKLWWAGAGATTAAGASQLADPDASFTTDITTNLVSAGLEVGVELLVTRLIAGGVFSAAGILGTAAGILGTVYLFVDK